MAAATALAIAAQVPGARAVVTMATRADTAQAADLGRISVQALRQRETSTGQLDHIEREVQFDGELTDQQRARLVDIAERCPVHRTLHSEVLVSTTEHRVAR